MKDATGELSMTAVAVVAIAAIALLFQQFVWPVIQRNIQTNAYCSQTISCECGKAKSVQAEVGTVTSSSDKTCSCIYTDDKGKTHGVLCPNNAKDAASTAAAGGFKVLK